MKIVKGMAIGLTVAVIVSVLIAVVANSLNRPQMVVNENGQCEKAWGPDGKIDCQRIKKADYGKFDIVPVPRNIEIKNQ